MNIYQTVTDRILKQLETGVAPWRRTWETGIPKSLTTGREYRGVNILVLSSAGYSSRYWVTYREAQRLGGYVRKGERATPVIFWKWRTPEDLKQLAEKTGRQNLAPCVAFTSAVFNLNQVEGVAQPDDDVPNRANGRLDVADRMVTVMPDKPRILHTASREPSYSPRIDAITLPHLSQFESGAEYYAALFHELAHSTGHPKRLNRFSELEGDRVERYSFEELVAEFGAAFLCSFAGINSLSTEALQASYIDGWTKALKSDNRLIVRAASAGQRAADYIRGKLPAQDITERPELTAESASAAGTGTPSAPTPLPTPLSLPQVV